MATRITESSVWSDLKTHHGEVRDLHLREIFATDPSRGERLVTVAGDLYVDHAKHRVTDGTLALLRRLANEREVAPRFGALLAGEHVNTTEDRPALHTALRRRRDEPLVVDGIDVVAQVHDVLDRMMAFAERVRGGDWRGSTGQPIRSIVNIGIGGSDLGPAMAATALRRWVRDDLELHFVSNVDGDDLADTLRRVDAASTLFIIASKSFSTLETLTNAEHAKAWLLQRLGDGTDVAAHFVALSTNADAVRAFGIDPENMFGFWDWVGGRYSVDSAIGLSLLLGIGPQNFREFLAGFRTIDEHVAADPVGSAPTTMALLNLWYRNLFGAQTQAVLPYSDALTRFPAYLQQLEMESNGKRVLLDGTVVDHDTGSIVWGEPGTNGQHAFYQLLHQGTTLVPCDFIGFVRPTDDALADSDHHDLLTANLLAQAEALAFGRTAAEVEAAGEGPPPTQHGGGHEQRGKNEPDGKLRAVPL